MGRTAQGAAGTSTRRRLLALDLFSGAGGLTTGLTQAGFTVVGAIDVDELAYETYRDNHPTVRIWNADIRTLWPADVRRELGLRRGRLDLLAGCPPCQGFSSIRTRNGVLPADDPRNDLVDQFIRYVREFEPKTVMVENVPALAKDPRLQLLLSTLESIGYKTGATIRDAQRYGVPQRRRRLIVLASRLGPIPCAEPSPEVRTVRHAIGKLPAPGSSGDPLHDLRETRSPSVLRIIAQIPRDGGSRSALPLDLSLDCHKASNGFHDVYGRMAWDLPSPTITGGCVSPSKGRFLHPEANRAITLREAAILQTFPRGYRFSLRRGKYAVAEMIGNALPPEFIRRHAEPIAAHIRKGRRGGNHAGS